MAKRILVVDDEIRVLTVIEKRLVGAGYEVIKAMDGNEALMKAHAEKPDLIVLDLMLPKVNGYQVCGILKREASYKHIPILMLTARSQEKDVDEGMRVGADAYMMKPFKGDMLIDQIQRLLAGVDEKKEKMQQEKLAKEKALGEKLIEEAERMGVIHKKEPPEK